MGIVFDYLTRLAPLLPSSFFCKRVPLPYEKNHLSRWFRQDKAQSLPPTSQQGSKIEA
jgi:hypothetical protein